MSELAKSFEPGTIENHWNQFWESKGLFQAGLDTTKPSFAIQLPPPNVTGSLHMGHAFNQTIMDALTRFHRMSGFNTLWQPGVDHAGIATQIVVERQLQEAKTSRRDLGREKFLEKVWEWKEKSGQTIVQQMRRLGASVDWQREYFTMEPRLSEVVTQTFVQLYEAGLIYRGKRLVNWDPKLKTAVSDLEVEMIERKGFMWHILYPFSDGAQKDGHGNVLKGMTIATTRPETMLADGAVCVHPEDERFRHLVGKYVDLPLCDRKIPVIADDFVDREFGSGCVKITGAHDFNDYACALRHQLPLLTIMTESAAINENAPHAYHGLDRYDARKAVVADLAAQGFLQAVKPHVSMVPVCTRTGEIVEPMLTNQWFVDLTRDKLDDGRVGGNQAMVQPALKAVADGAIKLFPEYWVNTYNQWLHNIQDWCISRQLWWGHQIPAWYAENGSVFVAVDEQAAKAKALATGYHGHLTRDADVLDTWFSSALVPFSTLGWPQPQAQEKAIYKLYLPSSVLVTGYDIIFFWVARMVMMTLYFTNKVPFHHVYVHGLVRDAQGKKMSKSEGNTLDPVDLIDGIDLTSLIAKRLTGLRRPELAESIEKHTRAEFPHGIPKFGADALRFTFASLASLGNNINFDSKRCEGYRNFCNKLWNATRFVLMHTQDQDCAIDLNTTPYESSQFSDFDRWIITQLQHTEAAVAQGFADYRLDLVAQSIYQFVWDHYCDWYLEVAKIQLQSSDANIKQATRHVLVQVLEATLRLAHPLIPYITEELWLVVAKVAGKASTSIVLAPYPQSEASKCFAVSETIVAQLQQVITSVRNLRSEMKLAPARKVAMQILGRPTYIHQNLVLIQTLCRLSEVGFFDDELIWQEKIGHAPVLVLEKVRMALSVPIDKAVEQERLNKEKQKLEAEIVKIKTKLQSENFLKKAPAAIVEQEKERLQQFSNILNKITQQLTMIR